MIEIGDPGDLSRLEAFVRSLEAAKHHSEATAKMCRQCKVLYNAALQYTESSTSKGSQAQDHNDFEAFDSFIQTLGMPPFGALEGLGNDYLFQAMNQEQGLNV